VSSTKKPEIEEDNQKEVENIKRVLRGKATTEEEEEQQEEKRSGGGKKKRKRGAGLESGARALWKGGSG